MHANLVGVDADRRDELLRRLTGDTRFTVAVRAHRRDAERGVVVVDTQGIEPHAAELIRRLIDTGRATAILAVLHDEDDLEFARSLLLAGAAGITSLRQPSSGLCEAVVDVADGRASVSAAVEADLVRLLQSLSAD